MNGKMISYETFAMIKHYDVDCNWLRVEHLNVQKNGNKFLWPIMAHGRKYVPLWLGTSIVKPQLILCFG